MNNSPFSNHFLALTIYLLDYVDLISPWHNEYVNSRHRKIAVDLDLHIKNDDVFGEELEKIFEEKYKLVDNHSEEQLKEVAKEYEQLRNDYRKKLGENE